MGGIIIHLFNKPNCHPHSAILHHFFPVGQWKLQRAEVPKKAIKCWIPNIFVSPDWLGIVHKQHIFFKIFQGMHLNYVVML